MILRDDIAHHRKFLLAGQLIGGPAGAARALAVWVGAIGYARSGLTNGIVHDAFLETFSLDSDAKLIGKVLSLKRIRLFHRIKGGYVIHDFDQHNGSTEKLLRERELARDRKRRQRAQQTVENSDLREAVTPLSRRDSRAREKGKRKGNGVRTCTSTVRSPKEEVDVPKREQRPDGRDPSPGLALSSSQKHELARLPSADDNFAVLVRLAHTVMDAENNGDPTSPNLIEAVKCAAAERRIEYHHDTFNRALRSAGTQRVRGTRASQSGPLQPFVDGMRQAVAMGTMPAVIKRMARR